MMTVVMVVTSCRAYKADCQQEKQSNGFHNYSLLFRCPRRSIKSLHNSFDYKSRLRASSRRQEETAFRERLLTRRRETEGRFGERVETIDQKVELPSAAEPQPKKKKQDSPRRHEGFESFNYYTSCSSTFVVRSNCPVDSASYLWCARKFAQTA
jgi:hypothetical protein